MLSWRRTACQSNARENTTGANEGGGKCGSFGLKAHRSCIQYMQQNSVGIRTNQTGWWPSSWRAIKKHAITTPAAIIPSQQRTWATWDGFPLSSAHDCCEDRRSALLCCCGVSFCVRFFGSKGGGGCGRVLRDGVWMLCHPCPADIVAPAQYSSVLEQDKKQRTETGLSILGTALRRSKAAHRRHRIS